MSEPYIVVKNFDTFQHYKHRNPPWIRLYTRLLDADDVAYSRLQDASKALAIHIWMLASRHDNKIPADINWLQRRLNLQEPINLEPLLSAGFISIKNGDASTVLARCKQNALSEKSRVETEKSRVESDLVPSATKTSRTVGSRFTLTQLPEEWKSFCESKRSDLNPSDTFDAFRDYWIAVAGAKGRKSDWTATWRNWVRNQKAASSNGHKQFLTRDERDAKDLEARLSESRKYGGSPIDAFLPEDER